MTTTPDGLQGTTQALTKLVEVQGGPVKSKGTGRRQRPNTNSAVSIQSPQSIAAGSQLSQLHLSTQKQKAECSGTSFMNVDQQKENSRNEFLRQEVEGQRKV